MFVKLIPISQDLVASKTIYIRDIDDDGKFTNENEYIKYGVKNKEDMRDIYKNGKGLVHVSESTTAIVNYDIIEDREKYQVFRYSQDFAGWQKKEAEAMEAETRLSMKAFLEEKFQAQPAKLSTDFFDKEGRQVQEWDGVLFQKILFISWKPDMQ